MLIANLKKNEEALRGNYIYGNTQNRERISLKVRVVQTLIKGIQQNRSYYDIASQILDIFRSRHHSTTTHQSDKKIIATRLVQPIIQSLNKKVQSSTEAHKIAERARQVATKLNSKGRCYHGVKAALRSVGVELKGRSAYMARDQLMALPKNFMVLAVSPNKFNTLPEGSIVVWGRSAQKPHGHISIALGNGLEASDHIQKQITNGARYGEPTVFIPVSRNTDA